jgi:hypothetical protein
MHASGLLEIQVYAAQSQLATCCMAVRAHMYTRLDSITSGAFGQLMFDEPLDTVLLGLLGDSYWGDTAPAVDSCVRLFLVEAWAARELAVAARGAANVPELEVDLESEHVPGPMRVRVPVPVGSAAGWFPFVHSPPATARGPMALALRPVRNLSFFLSFCCMAFTAVSLHTLHSTRYPVPLCVCVHVKVCIFAPYLRMMPHIAYIRHIPTRTATNISFPPRNRQQSHRLPFVTAGCMCGRLAVELNEALSSQYRSHLI